MQVTQLIKASADVVTITSLSPGNVYKRVEASDYSGASLRFGIVQDVMNNGEDAAVTAIEYKPDYTNGVTVEMKVYDGSKPVSIFAATPDEVRAHMAELVKAAEDKVERAQTELDRANEIVTRVRSLDVQVADRSLTAPTVAGTLMS